MQGYRRLAMDSMDMFNWVQWESRWKYSVSVPFVEGLLFSYLNAFGKLTKMVGAIQTWKRNKRSSMWVLGFYQVITNTSIHWKVRLVGNSPQTSEFSGNHGIMVRSKTHNEGFRQGSFLFGYSSNDCWIYGKDESTVDYSWIGLYRSQIAHIANISKFASTMI